MKKKYSSKLASSSNLIKHLPMNRALQAPIHEKTLRGRNLRISPADSWHQPSEDSDGRVRWKPSCRREDAGTPTWSTEQQNGVYSKLLFNSLNVNV